MNRRQFLQAGLILATLPARAFSKHGSELLYLSAQSQRDDQRNGFGWLAPDSGQHHFTDGPFRGHGVSLHPGKSQRGLLYARRPGTELIEVDLTDGRVTARGQAATGRHFYGHGCFSADGRTLFTSESDYHSGNGKIGIRDAQSYQQIGEYDSHAIGPHEIALMPDGKTLVVANGGLLTHPDSQREVLNPDTMDSRLTYLDLGNGSKLDDFKVSEEKASIRHLAVATDGTVAVGLQMQRLAAMHSALAPLVALQRPGQSLTAVMEPRETLLGMNDYAGSVSINNRYRIAAITSPRGNIATFWSLDSAECLGTHKLQDVCGVAVTPDQSQFVLSNSFGQIRHLDAKTLEEQRDKRIIIKNARWDNHLLAVAV